MNRLILFRHGKAERNAPSGKDFDRALAPRGQADARAMGERLAAAGIVPDLVLVSAARRTRETWEAARQTAFPTARVEIVPALYNAERRPDPGGWPKRRTRRAAVMVVGHNPGMHEAAIRMLRAGQTRTRPWSPAPPRASRPPPPPPSGWKAATWSGRRCFRPRTPNRDQDLQDPRPRGMGGRAKR